MRLGLKLWSINTDAYLSEAKRLHEEGVFDYLELFAVPESLHTLPVWKNFKIPYIVHSAHFATGFNLADPAMRGRNMQIYAQTKQFADELDAQYIIFHGGMNGSPEELAGQLKSLGEPRALIENKPKIPLASIVSEGACRGYSPEEIEYVMRETGCGLCLDFGHAAASANAQGLDIYSYMESFMKLRPSMFHLSDMEDSSSPADSHEHFGNGTLDLARILKMIPSDSLVSIETKKLSKENLDDFKEDVICLRNFQ